MALALRRKKKKEDKGEKTLRNLIATAVTKRFQYRLGEIAAWFGGKKGKGEKS